MLMNIINNLFSQDDTSSTESSSVQCNYDVDKIKCCDNIIDAVGNLNVIINEMTEMNTKMIEIAKTMENRKIRVDKWENVINDPKSKFLNDTVLAYNLINNLKNTVSDLKLIQEYFVDTQLQSSSEAEQPGESEQPHETDQSGNIQLEKVVNTNINAVICQVCEGCNNCVKTSLNEEIKNDNCEKLDNIAKDYITIKQKKMDYFKNRYGNEMEDDYSNIISFHQKNPDDLVSAINNLTEDQITAILQKMSKDTSIEQNRTETEPHLDSIYHQTGDPLDKIEAILDDDSQDRLVLMMAERRKKLESEQESS